MNYLSVIKAQKQWGMTLGEGELTKIAVTFERETEPQVIQRLWELIADWVDTNKHIPLEVAHVIGCIPDRLHSQNLLEGGVAGSVIDTLNVMALLEDSRLLPLLEESTRQLLHQIDIKRVQDSKVVDLLGALGRVDGQFLQTLVERDCPPFPSRNIRAVALAIRRVEREASSLLDPMLASDWCPGEVKSLILEWRRA
ncbi:hypothetical protein ACE1CM_09800 [Microseira sp. BLCC-F43]